MPWGHDWASHDDAEVKGECCRQNCHSVMHERALTCDVGEMRDEHDYHMPWGHDWATHDDAEGKGECCRQNCHSVMHERALTCDVGDVRPSWDWHQIDWSASNSYLKSECCQQNCHSVMHERVLTCAAEDGRPRHQWDYYQPFGNDWSTPSNWEIKSECCVNICYDVMRDYALTCDAGVSRNEWDYHKHISGEKWTNLPHSEIKSECCQQTCHNYFNENDVTCAMGQVLRDKDDFHQTDWNAPPEQVKDECCSRNCYTVMDERSLTCPHNHHVRDKRDFHELNWDSTSSEDLQRECCLYGVRRGLSSDSTCISCPADYDVTKSENHGYNPDRICNACDEETPDDLMLTGFHVADVRKCKHVEENTDVRITETWINCGAGDDRNYCIGEVVIEHSLTASKHAFLSLKAVYKGEMKMKLRIGKGSFPLYWFSIGPENPSPYTVQFRGHIQPPGSQPLSRIPDLIRVKLKHSKRNALSCVVYKDL